MIIRPVAPVDHAEWLRMRLPLWGGTAQEHTHDIDALRHTTAWCHLRGGKHWRRRCGCIEVSLRHDAEGCMTSPVASMEGWYVEALSTY
jgi:hypothetical protein